MSNSEKLKYFIKVLVPFFSSLCQIKDIFIKKLFLQNTKKTWFSQGFKWLDWVGRRVKKSCQWQVFSQSLGEAVMLRSGSDRSEPPPPTLSEKCMFLSGFIRTALNIPKTKAFGRTQKSFNVKQKCTLDISWHQMCISIKLLLSKTR